MKTVKYSVLAAAALALVACNKNVSSNVEPWMQDENAPVPVQIAGSSFNYTSKAAIESLNPEGGEVHFGVFGLGEQGKDTEVLFQGSAGDGANALDSYKDEDTGLAVLMIDGFPAYYPIRPLNNYSFYGYHVGETADNTTLECEEDGTYSIEIEDYSHTDILYASAVANDFTVGETTYQGFNSRYVRKAKYHGHADELPKFEFKHITSAVYFSIVAESPAAEESFEFDNANVRVTKVEIHGLPAKAKLYVTKNYAPSGEIEEEAGSEPVVYDYEDAPYYPTVDGTSIDEGYFIKPSSVANLDFLFTIKQRPVQNEDKNIVYKVSGESILANIGTTDPESGEKAFLPGYKYFVKITVSEAMTIDINVDLEDWLEDGPVDAGNIEDLPVADDED